MRFRKLQTAIIWVLALSVLLSTQAFAANVTTVANIPQSTAAAVNYVKQQFGTPGNSYTIPGLMQSVTRTSNGSTVTTCSNMVPQGLTFCGPGEKYILISAYCNCGAGHKSVIYVIDTNTKAYQVTLITDTSCHVGGMAYDGNYIWVCDTQSGGKHLRAYKYSSVEDAIVHNYWTIYTQATVTVDTAPSFLCYANGYLYVGTFSETATTAQIYFYQPNGKTIARKGSFTINGISKIQGMSIRSGNMVLSTSYGRRNTSKVYVFNDPIGRFATNGAVYHAANARSFNLPNMAEGCYIGSGYTYFLFESGSKSYRESTGTMPLDKYLRLGNDRLGVDLALGRAARLPDGVYTVRCSGDTGFGWDISGFSNDNGANLQVWNSQHKFVFTRGSDGYYTIRALGSGKPLDVYCGNTANGTNITQYQSTNTDNQKWVALSNSDGTWSFVSKCNGKYIDMNGGGAPSNGKNLQCWAGNGTNAQKWVLQKPATLPSGIYTMGCAANGGVMLDVDGQSMNNGANLHLWTAHGGESQKWVFTDQHNGYYTIRNLKTGKYLDVSGGGTANGTNAIQWTGSGGDNQLWQVVENGSGTYTLVSKCNGLALDMSGGGSPYNGQNVQCWSINTSNAQRWRLTPQAVLSSGTYRMGNKANTNLQIEVPSGSTANGSNVQVWSSHSGAWQKITVTHNGDGTYTLGFAHSGKVMDASGWGTANGTNVCQYEASGGNNQKWLAIRNEDGSYTFVNCHSGLALDLSGGGSPYNGQNIQCWSINSSDAQKWVMMKP